MRFVNWDGTQITGTLTKNNAGGNQRMPDKDNFNAVIQIQESNQAVNQYSIRRLTPVECCRLQGFPDWWEDGANGSDTERYQMWGNGIALPCATDVLGKIAKAAEREHEDSL